MKVELNVTNGPMTGKIFEFTEHDTFVFGRSSNAKCCLPDDKYISRNHFLLEINPPRVRVRDLGSLNKTEVNGVRFGGREQEGQKASEVNINNYSGFIQKNLWKREDFERDIIDGDEIKVGETVMKVSIKPDAKCSYCGTIIDEEDKDECSIGDDKHICRQCKINEEEEKQKQIQLKKKKAEIKKRDKEAEASAADLLMNLLFDIAKSGKSKDVPTFPGYEVIKKIGEGGMGAVYLAVEKRNNRKAAIKIIKPESNPDNTTLRRFKREIEIAKSLKHKNIVLCYDGNYTDGVYYMIMEYIEGLDTLQFVEKYGILKYQSACSLMIQALDGLDYIHKNNIVHRDLKPQNIMLENNGDSWIAKVTDFGLAKNLKTSSSITGNGDCSGTLPFMAPEQILDFKHVGPASDIYSMGATLYLLCTGQMPHDYPPTMDPVLVILQSPFIPIERRISRIPNNAASIINKSLAYKINDRYKSAKEFKNALLKII